MDAYEQLRAANRAIEDADRRLAAYREKSGIPEDSAVLPDSDEIRQIVADLRKANKDQQAAIDRLLA